MDPALAGDEDILSPLHLKVLNYLGEARNWDVPRRSTEVNRFFSSDEDLSSTADAADLAALCASTLAATKEYAAGTVPEELGTLQREPLGLDVKIYAATDTAEAGPSVGPMDQTLRSCLVTRSHDSFDELDAMELKTLRRPLQGEHFGSPNDDTGVSDPLHGMGPDSLPHRGPLTVQVTSGTGQDGGKRDALALRDSCRTPKSYADRRSSSEDESAAPVEIQATRIGVLSPPAACGTPPSTSRSAGSDCRSSTVFEQGSKPVHNAGRGSLRAHGMDDGLWHPAGVHVSLSGNVPSTASRVEKHIDPEFSTISTSATSTTISTCSGLPPRVPGSVSSSGRGCRINSDFWDEHVENRGGVEVVVESPSSVQGRLQRLEQRQRAQSQGAVRRRPSPARGYPSASAGTPPAVASPTSASVVSAKPFGDIRNPSSRPMVSRRIVGPSRRSSSASPATGRSSNVTRQSTGQTATGVHSNRKLIRNALEKYCLKGDANREQREQILQSFDVELKNFERFVILFRSTYTGRHDFRALYAYEDGKWMRVLHTLQSPHLLSDRMVAQVLRFNSGSKEFKEVHNVQEIVNVADAVFIKPEYLPRARAP